MEDWRKIRELEILRRLEEARGLGEPGLSYNAIWQHLNYVRSKGQLSAILDDLERRNLVQKRESDIDRPQFPTVIRTITDNGRKYLEKLREEFREPTPHEVEETLQTLRQRVLDARPSERNGLLQVLLIGAIHILDYYRYDRPEEMAASLQRLFLRGRIPNPPTTEEIRAILRDWKGRGDIQVTANSIESVRFDKRQLDEAAKLANCMILLSEDESDATARP